MKLFTGVAAAFMLLAAPVAHAALSIQVQSESIAGSNSSTVNGFFDVFLNVTGTGNGLLGGWEAQVQLASGSGMTLGTPTVTDVSPSSRTMALLTDSAFTTNLVSLPNTASAVAADQFLSSGSVSLDGENGDGLMRVPFTLSAGSQGTYDLDINTTNTFLGDAEGDPISYTPVNGVITVAVPEPASVSLILLSAAGLLARRRRPAAGDNLVRIS